MPESFAREEGFELSEAMNVQEDSRESIEFCGLTFSMSVHDNTVKFDRYSEQVTVRHEEHKTNIVSYLEMIKDAGLQQLGDNGMIIFADD